MTLAEYGLQYHTWANEELKAFASARKLKLQRNERASWIALLRAQDRKHNITFLKLPPELRNMVYKELLTPIHSSNGSSSVFCHPAILQSCRQILNEAADLIYTTTAIPLSVCLASRPTEDFWFDVYEYAVAVSFNGRKIVCGKKEETPSTHKSLI